MSTSAVHVTIALLQCEKMAGLVLAAERICDVVWINAGDRQTYWLRLDFLLYVNQLRPLVPLFIHAISKGACMKLIISLSTSRWFSAQRQ